MQRNQRISSRLAIPIPEPLACRESESAWQNLRGRRAAHDYRHYTATNATLFVNILPKFLLRSCNRDKQQRQQKTSCPHPQKCLCRMERKCLCWSSCITSEMPRSGRKCRRSLNTF